VADHRADRRQHEGLFIDQQHLHIPAPLSLQRRPASRGAPNAGW
jgi:hypothetical protein